MSNLRLEIPGKLEPILRDSARYKVSHGGRGSGKSWTYGRGLLVKGLERPMRILCTREVQRSIKDSVHRLLSDQIKELGLGGAYEILDNEIRGYNGTLFIFSGLSTHTADSLKSYEGVDIVWVEEAQTVSKKSWDVLTPTIRKPGSEIWISLNPILDTDPTYQRFVLQPPEGSIVIEVNWWDNPWFPDTLQAERLHAKKTMSADDYENIWEGKPRSAVEGAIYATEVTNMIRAGRFRPLPYDPMLKVHTIWDLGWNDATSIALVQKVASEVRIIHYIEDNQKTLDHYAAELNQMRLNWGKDWLPHDGHSATLAAGGISAARILKRLGRNVSMQPIPNVPIETGIKVARMLFQRTYIDHEYGARLVECLKRYRRGISQTTGEPGSPVHDEFSHGADVWRYLALSVELLSNEDERESSREILREWRPNDRAVGY